MKLKDLLPMLVFFVTLGLFVFIERGIWFFMILMLPYMILNTNKFDEITLGLAVLIFSITILFMFIFYRNDIDNVMGLFLLMVPLGYLLTMLVRSDYEKRK